MAGFFPHIGGAATAGFTPLPIVEASGVLDSIVSDIGAGVNGWSVHDDMRTSGSSYPWSGTGIHIPINGLYTQNNVGSGICWTFTTNSANITANHGQYGYHPAYSGPYHTGSQWDISVDLTTWYSLPSAVPTYISNGNTQYMTTNYAGATTNTRYVHVRSKSYIVLKCTSSTKTFYVMLARMPTPTPITLWVRVYETWDNSTHTGTGGGEIEIMRAYLESSARVDISMQYIAAFYTDAMYLWMSGLTGQGVTSYSCATYAGNLDTTGLRTGDASALAFISTDTSYSGQLPVVGSTYATNWVNFGCIQLLSTLSGKQWIQSYAYQTGPSKENCYMIYPRGRSYLNAGAAPVIDSAARVQFCDVDVYQAGRNQGAAPYGPTLASEHRRGMLRYVKLPMFNPSAYHLSTFGPAADGNTYIIIRSSVTFGEGDGTPWTYGGNDYLPASSPQACGFCSTSPKSTTEFADIKVESYYDVASWRYHMIPVL